MSVTETGENINLDEVVAKSGSLGVAALFHRAITFILALILIVLALPFFVIVALLVRIKLGRPVIYKGVRYGFNKQEFVMYKFRTLANEASHILGAALLTKKVAADKALITTFGRYLRSTRLDELPQLINVLKGDMNFVGPRPERPEIYEKFCKHIDGYDLRFLVKPGLIGYSQLFTPHLTPKRIRTYIDNIFIRRDQPILQEIVIIFRTIWAVLVKTFMQSFRFFFRLRIKAGKLTLYKEKRSMERISLGHASTFRQVARDGHVKFHKIGRLIDINEDAFLVFCNEILGEQETIGFKLNSIHTSGLRGRKKMKSAVVDGQVFSRTELDDDAFAYGYVMRYMPRTPLDYYMIHQYFLRESVIDMRMRWF